MGGHDEERAYYAFQRRAWSLFAPFYDAVVFLPLYGLRRRVAGMVTLGQGSRVLDVATGTGGQARAFAELGQQVVGVDLSEAMLRIASRKNHLPNISFVLADGARLPFADSSFDATCVSFALHEMPATVRDRVLQEMARVTRPGAQIIIVDYGLPKGRVARCLVFQAGKAYEGQHYAHFVEADLVAVLAAARIHVIAKHVVLKGSARIWVAVRARTPS